jgi:amino acid adenylation domain-containing protein
MEQTAVMWVERTAERAPENIALEDGATCLTYRELRQMALAVGSGILARADFSAVPPGISAPIAVFLPKSHAALVAFMGILYSGNIYVPIDDRMPAARLSKIWENLQPALIITDAAGREKLCSGGMDADRLALYDDLLASSVDRAAVDARLAAVVDTDPIYIMYTSGSTGTPKGVTVTHRGVMDYAQWVAETFAIDETSSFGNQAPFYFDNSILDIYTSFLTGAKLIIIPEILFQFPVRLPAFLQEKAVDTIFWVPTVMINVANSGALAEENLTLPALRRILFCGEAMPNKQLNIWRRAFPDKLYANLYGPTEISDVCTCFLVDREFADSDPLPIGRACRNMRVWVLDEEDKLSPPGEIGELCVQGTGLALGYWDRPDLTAAAFVDCPLSPPYAAKMYRTGDLVRREADGLLYFIGRKDSQIKHKGNRIELEEIETAGKSLPGVHNLCVLYDEEKQEIVMFLEAEAPLDPRQLTRAFHALLPKYMIPGRFVQLPALPYNANGKIDRVQLRAVLKAGE